MQVYAIVMENLSRAMMAKMLYINNAAGASLWLFGLVDFFQPFIKRFFKALLRGIDKLQRL